MDSIQIGCAILAGGKSSRMGTDKALLTIDGQTFLAAIADALGPFEEKILAGGAHTDFSAAISSDWIFRQDLYPGHGPIGGLHAALSDCRSDALFITTCDMPLLQRSLADHLCDAARAYAADSTPFDALVPVTDNGLGRIQPLCAVYKKSALPFLEEQIHSNQNRMMAALKRMNTIYVHLPEAFSAQLQNINTAGEYQALLGANDFLR